MTQLPSIQKNLTHYKGIQFKSSKSSIRNNNSISSNQPFYDQNSVNRNSQNVLNSHFMTSKNSITNLEMQSIAAYRNSFQRLTKMSNGISNSPSRQQNRLLNLSTIENSVLTKNQKYQDKNRILALKGFDLIKERKSKVIEHQKVEPQR